MAEWARACGPSTAPRRIRGSSADPPLEHDLPVEPAPAPAVGRRAAAARLGAARALDPPALEGAGLDEGHELAVPRTGVVLRFSVSHRNLPDGRERRAPAMVQFAGAPAGRLRQGFAVKSPSR